LKLFQVIDELVQDRGLDRSVVADIICQGMLGAYSKRYPEIPLTAAYNKKTDDIDVFVDKETVSAVEDSLIQMNLRKAREFKKDAQIGDIINVPFEGTIGRIEILRAKQIISQEIRAVEAAAVYKEFKEKEGTIINGVVHKCERSGVTIVVNDTFAFLPKSLTPAGERCVAGYTVRALLKEVLEEPVSENQLILDRVSPRFLELLFELEIPEVYERIVEIKKIVRSPGYKSKVLVASNDDNIDPVGTCVGVHGSRIKPILKELGDERVDVISWSESLEVLVRGAMKPAHVERVEIVDDQNINVWVDEEQHSIAIGKMGKNIGLASELVGHKIHLVRDGDVDRQHAEAILSEEDIGLNDDEKDMDSGEE